MPGGEVGRLAQGQDICHGQGHKSQTNKRQPGAAHGQDRKTSQGKSGRGQPDPGRLEKINGQTKMIHDQIKHIPARILRIREDTA